MTSDVAVDIIYRAIITIFMVSLPAVGAGLIVGFLISLFQAVTQIQEQTLTFVPKVITVLSVVALMFPMIVSMMTEFATNLWVTLPNLVK